MATNQAFFKILESLLSNIHQHTTDKIPFLWNSRTGETNTWLLEVRKDSTWRRGHLPEMRQVGNLQGDGNVLHFDSGGGCMGVNICMHFTICRWYLTFKNKLKKHFQNSSPSGSPCGRKVRGLASPGYLLFCLRRTTWVMWDPGRRNRLQ